MANNKKYGYRASGSKAKPIIITCASVVAVIGGILGYIAIKTNDENRIAALKYEFNKYYPSYQNIQEEFDPDMDYDNDGFSNDEEKMHKTKVIIADTDNDGIIDSMESVYGTDPNVSDCDSDGINDGVEILAGLDPLSPISDGKTKDAERSFTREIEFGEGTLTITGAASVYGATMESLSLNAVTSNTGAVTLAYELYSAEGFEDAQLTLNYNETLLKASELDPEDLKIFKFDPYLKTYEVIGGTVDKKNRCVTTPITVSGVYVLGADTVVEHSVRKENSQINVHILIDNSGSMYPKSVQSTSEENDINFKRLTFACGIVNNLSPDAKAAISAFTYEFKNLSPFSSDKAKVIESINGIRRLGVGIDGTSVERALMIGLQSFTKDMADDNNYIILLTDGISTDTAGFSVEDITAAAKSKNVTIMTISLGNSIDRNLLQTIADMTGGKYFPISEANILEGLSTTMLASMQDDIVDEDYDGKPDSYTLFDTGFLAETNGFSFNNFRTKDSDTLDFGMVMLARDWFKNAVPNSMEIPGKDLSYTFEGTTINTSEPLRKVFLQCMQEKWLDPEYYLNFSAGTKALNVNSSEEKAARDKGWGAVLVPYKYSDTWTNIELLYPDHNNKLLRTNYSENDYQMIRTIVCYDTLRSKTNSFTLNTENDLNKVKKILGTGTPVITKITWEQENNTYMSRYVLLTTLRRDLENPNIFKLKVYDVNPESPNSIVVSRTLVSSPNGTDYTYSGIWNDKKVSLTFCLANAEQMRQAS